MSSAQIFATNLSSKKMKSATTIGEIRAAMSPFSKTHENAFWEYLCGRAMRAAKKGVEPSVIERLALQHKTNIHHKPRVGISDSPDAINGPVSKTVASEKSFSFGVHNSDDNASTIGCGEAIIEDNLETVDKYLDTHPPETTGDVLKAINKLIPEGQREGLIDHVKKTVSDMIFCGENPYDVGAGSCVISFWNEVVPTTVPTAEILTKAEPEPDYPEPDYPEPDTKSVYSRATTMRTNMTFIDRMTPDNRQYRAFIKDVTALPSKELLKDLPSFFHPVEGLLPYGNQLNTEDDTIFDDMMRYIKCDNICEEARSRGVVILLHYINRFLIYDESTKCVYRLKYNERGYVTRMTWLPLSNAEDGYFKHGTISKTENMFTLWRNMSCRKRVERCIREPIVGPRKTLMPDGDYVLNTFLGLDVELNYDLEAWTPGQVDITPITNHIKCVLAQNDDYIYRYLLKWMYTVLIRKQKTNVALMFTGCQGTGKSAIFDDFIGKQLMGEGPEASYYYMVGMNLLIGRFNGSTSGRLLICADEVDARTKHKSDALKSHITQKSRNTEKKGKEAETSRDFSNLVITTNHENAVKIEETDRRYFVQKLVRELRTPEENIRYFNELYNAIENPLSAPEFYVWLKTTVENTVNIMGVNLKNIPITQAKLDRMLDDTHPMYRWLQNKYSHNPSWQTGDVVIQHDLVKSFSTDEEYRNVKVTPHQFTDMFKKLGFQEGPQGRGRCWKMMSFDDFKTAMKTIKKWDDNI